MQKHESLNGGRLRGYDIRNIIEEEFGVNMHSEVYIISSHTIKIFAGSPQGLYTQKLIHIAQEDFKNNLL